MDSIAQIEAILHSKNKAIQHKEYAQKKAQHWHDIAQSFADQETLCGMLLNKNYVMNLHNLVEKQEQTYTNDNYNLTLFCIKRCYIIPYMPRACIRKDSWLFGTMHTVKTKTLSSAESFHLRMFDGM